MGIGSYFLFINATPWPFNLGKSSSYQMNTWSWPSSIESGSAVQVYIEDNNAPGITESDDAAEVYYTVDSLGPTFEILYQGNNSDNPIQIIYKDTFEADITTAGTQIALEWAQNKPSPFILAAADTDLSTATIVGTYPAINWMTANYERIQCLSLRELAIPGSHDSGMSQLSGGRGGAIVEDTVTQTLDFADQLNAGVRYFDVRPVISAGDWTTGHYSYTTTLSLGWVGGNGQAIDSIISQINDFTGTLDINELLIISLSHGLDTDIFADDPNNHLTQDDWNDLIATLQQINYLATGFTSSDDLSTKLVSEFIATGPAVVIIIDDVVEGGGGIEISSGGFFPATQLSLFNQYSDTDNETAMAEDQLNKMLQNTQNSDHEMFLLSWTLTQNTGDIINFAGASILDLAAKANPLLYENLWINMNEQQYPNILLLDAMPDGDVAALALAINYYFAKTCDGSSSAAASSTSSESAAQTSESPAAATTSSPSAAETTSEEPPTITSTMDSAETTTEYQTPSSTEQAPGTTIDDQQPSTTEQAAPNTSAGIQTSVTQSSSQGNNNGATPVTTSTNSLQPQTIPPTTTSSATNPSSTSSGIGKERFSPAWLGMMVFLTMVLVFH